MQDNLHWTIYTFGESKEETAVKPAQTTPSIRQKLVQDDQH